MKQALFILYVADQERSRDFYRAVLAVEPSLDVPGMPEFALTDGGGLGLMPEKGIMRLLEGAITDPATASGVPRAEIYLLVDDAAPYIERALEAGARELSPYRARDWGHAAAYLQDHDGHVLAFATSIDDSRHPDERLSKPTGSC